VFLGVPVAPTERRSTPALEPGQPHALPTRAAPVRLKRCARVRRGHHRRLREGFNRRRQGNHSGGGDGCCCCGGG